MPTSPPETTSVESCPTTWPSCIANSVPPRFRIMRPAPATIPCISSGAFCWSTSVSESAMLSATGSASWVHTGIVSSVHCARVMRRGATVSWLT